MNSTFNFCGTVKCRKENWYHSGSTKNGKPYASINLIVETERNNAGFVEMFGMESDVIKCRDLMNKPLEVAWGDRFDDDIKDSVANYSKTMISYGDKREEFLSTYDAVRFLKENISDIEGKMFHVTGRITKNYYNGNVTNRFQIKNMYEAKEGSKPELNARFELFWNKDCVDADNFADDKLVYINGYTRDYISKDNPNVYVPMQVILGAEKIDFNNDMHLSKLDFKLKQIGLKRKGTKISSIDNGNGYKHIPVICRYRNGAEEIPFDESTLTENQKMAIELGINKLDDFRPKGSIYGNKITQFRIVNYNLDGEFADGAVDVDDTVEEFEEQIFRIPTEESLDDIIKDANKDIKLAEDDDDDDEGLWD